MGSLRSTEERRLSRAARFVALMLVVASGCKSVELGSPSCVVSDVSVLPGTTTVQVGGTVPLQATVSATGCDNAKVFWSSDHANLATVSQAGIVTGVAAGGPVTIAASAMGKSGTARITVLATPVSSISLSTPQPNVLAGRTLQLTATTRDAQGNVLSGRTVTWTTSSASVATVSSSGLVTGVASGGPVTVTGTSEGKSGTVSLMVLGRFGYAVITDPTAASFKPAASTSFNSSGLSIDVTHTGTGTHSVTFQGLAPPSGRAETAIVNAIGSTGSSCAVSSWASSGSSFVVNTQCVNASARREDTPFTVILLADDAIGGRTAFARASNPTATTAYSPPAGTGFNPSGKGITIARTGTGRYDVTFSGDGRVSGSAPETILVSPFAADVLCQVVQWSTTTAVVSVACTDALGTPKNAQFTVALIERGRAGARTAYTSISCAANGCTVPSTYTFNTGGAVSVSRTSAGVYRVTFAGAARNSGESDAVLVAPVSNLGGLCKAVTWANALNGRDMEVTVQCFGLGLTASDLNFDILLIE